MPSLPRPAVAVPATTAGRRRRHWPLVAAGGFLLAMVVVGRAIDVGSHLEAAQRWTAALGLLAPAVYVVVYVAATLVGVPGMPFTLLSPLLFGVGTAFGVMVVGSAISAALAFLIARYLARDSLAERLIGTDGFARLSALVEEHDWAVIPLLRIVPIAPFAVVNYGFGLTGISFWRYFGWSELAMIPMNALLVLGAGLFYDAATRGTASWPLLALAGAAALVLVALAALGRKAFARA
ncbi:MAG TPA: VTT domain-containing protein [Methylomirabilota bacterium]|nr:VTT domain-containing protein [Methylomirabilota bacterium]